MALDRHYLFVVAAIAILVFGLSAISPPSLMDDVDAVQAQIARSMLDSGDWVTARLNGVAYLEKAPMPYWMMAASFGVFGVRDWAARSPFVLSAIALCLLTARWAAWAYSKAAGLAAGAVLATSVGLWLFTRIQIPDVTLTLAIAFAMYSFLRGRPWHFWFALGIGFLLKGLIAMVFPVATVAVYWTVTRQWSRWRELRPFAGAALTLAVATPWVVLATLRNPPYFDFTMRSVAGEYHGFFWFFFLNEHLFRFLNMRHPRDYNTVPRLAFWLFHLLWLFPWSAWMPALLGGAREQTPAARDTRALCLCWIGFILVFFTFSTTQEYYSMPCYPAFALLLGAALAGDHPWLRHGWRILTVLLAVLGVALAAIFLAVRSYPAPGDISQALTLNPEAYTLSLGHMKDLTLGAFAYLRTPLAVAAAAFLAGAAGLLASRGTARVVVLAGAMIVFFQAARLALVAFDPYLSSRGLAAALAKSPPGTVIYDNQYYTFSSVFFYANRPGLLWNGRVNNLEYGSYAPGAPAVFLDDEGFAERWRGSERHYLLVEGPRVARVRELARPAILHEVAAAGGKFLYSNRGLQ
ncbi:MAG: glycosyltransferase family 39 protein [Bryobacteraceae bacterium]